MKKNLILSVVFIFSVLNVFSQQYVVRETIKKETVDVDFDKKNEIRVNLLGSILALPEINYEYFVEDNFGLGAVAAFSLENAYDSDLHSLFLVYGRLYFGNTKPATGFYIEGNSGLALEQSSNYNYNTQTYSSQQMYSGLGLGVAAGYKFLTKNNWVGELSLGVGRVYFSNSLEAYPRIGITIGKRF